MTFSIFDFKKHSFYSLLNPISIHFKPVLNNKLNGCSLEQVGEDFYIVGADSVRKKLGKLNFVLSTSVTIYYQDLNNVRTQVNAKITYTYKDGVLSHSVTNTSTGDTCTVSKTIAVS